jgi:hypothetical protein
MKKAFLVFLSTFLFLTTIYLSAQSASFESPFKGRDLPTPVDTAKLESAIREALPKFGWVITEDSPNLKVARFEKSGGKIFAIIAIKYDDKGYSIEYRDSKNLDVDLKAMTIHRNYVRWIANLDKAIYMNYFESTK